ncbi:MAG: matrixin family metalloprotease, partial [Myxococcales bacterium]|nr:matrixin family metalloprotease [Myxococcales bacterium]
MSKNTILFVVLLFASISQAHRYVCNGILANGDERWDTCGPCDDKNAARWPNPNIPVVVDNKSLPGGIDKKEWMGVVDDSFSAWNDISGSSLRFFQVDKEIRRDFGQNEMLHEIFWVNNSEEWRRLVGVGEFGTLGATLPRYRCGGKLGSKRQIFDADLALNAMPYINWKVKCEDDDCISIQTTLVHELGHFVGLDHPCLACSTSIMSARAVFDLMYPVLDDISGLQILYPDIQTGGFGSQCIYTSDCKDGFECIASNGSKYCTAQCSNDDDC